MLSVVSVRNIVLIDKLDLALDQGLTVLTGETGAGKSILLDALTLALGGRGDQSLVRSGCDSGQVTAIAHLKADHPARVAVRENEVTDDDELVLRRVQYLDGRTRAFINDQPVSGALLRKIGRLVVEIHGQHDDRALVDAATHRELLDAFGGHDVEVRATADSYAALQDAIDQVEAQRARVAKAAEDEDYARHVIDDLSALAPVVGEEDELSARRQHLMQLEKSADEVRDAEEILNGPHAPGVSLSALLRRLSRQNPDSIFGPLVETLDASLVALDRTNEALEDLKRQMAYDPHELEQVEERLFALRAAARKHQVMCDQLPDVLTQYIREIEELESGSEVLEKLEATAQAARLAYDAASAALSKRRQIAANELERAVGAELPDLKLGAARFIADHQIDERRISETGFDQIAFHVQTNPGTNPGPILKVASGGELSRFLLALKVVLAERGSAPVLIFDEIDTGVGGAVADAIGRRLARLADTVQVLSVTHAPQVAARASQHLLIEKQAVEEGAFVRTHVRPLQGNERNEEVARMLAGAEVTVEARAAATRLLSEVN